MSFQEVKEGGSTAQTARRINGGDANVKDPKENDSSDRGPETSTAEAEDEPSKKGLRHGGGIAPKPAAALKMREDDAMLRVRQDIRQPVTSLWQTAAERASTAPTRTASRRSEMVDCTNTAARRGSSRRRPHTQTGVARAKRDNGRADVNSGVGIVDECLRAGGRGVASGAGGEKRDATRGRSSRESEHRRANAETPGLVSTRGSGGKVVDRAKPGRRTPTPLRSSHRVGPVGSLGGRWSAVNIEIRFLLRFAGSSC